MIQIVRGPRPTTLKVFTNKSVRALDGVTKITKAEQELEKAVAFYTDTTRFRNEQKLTRETFAFAVYKDPDLQDQLEAIFGTKCAYCETDFGAVTPKEIEHFRPKSEITISADQTPLVPGYYWLAGEWNNLLVSCPDCNRGRRHKIPGQPKKVKLGKQTQFPLSDESKRARRGPSVASEEPVRLLLNPCIDKPEDHLTYDVQGLVHPRTGADGVESAMGRMSIMVCALQRWPLVQNRLSAINSFRLLFEQLNYLVKNHNRLMAEPTTTPDYLADNGAQIHKVKAAMIVSLGPQAPYLGMLRDWIRNTKKNGEFALLEQFGIDLTALIS